jgi:hypothetical protein
MNAGTIPVVLAGRDVFPQTAAGTGNFRFELAGPEDNPELLQFSRSAEMPGPIRLSFDRSPDYLAALRVEGRQAEVLVCRDSKTRRLVATGHRAIKTAFINGVATPLGYFSGLRVERGYRSGQILSRGYAFLRTLHANQPAPFYLTTIMEDNQQAKEVLASGRLGLPSYQDYGRFCCMAISLQGGHAHRSASGLLFRRANASDAAAVVEFLNSEGRSKQFFPQYRVEDFGCPGGLLSHLNWEDVFLGFRGQELVGVLAAWDQRSVRRWQVTGYVPWLRSLRTPLNFVARFRRMPTLPKPGSPLNYFTLALACIRDNDRHVFRSLLEEIIQARQSRHAFFLAGFHERDPLLPELLARPHVPLFSRLFVVAWEDGKQAVQDLNRGRIPYLELGSL